MFNHNKIKDLQLILNYFVINVVTQICWDIMNSYQVREQIKTVLLPFT